MRKRVYGRFRRCGKGPQETAEGRGHTALDVLVVEDHPLFRDALKRVVESTGEFRVVAAWGSVAELHAERISPPPSLAIVDLVLDDGDGITLLRDLRRLYPEIRCVMLTAYRDPWNVERARRAGATAFLDKATEPEQILATLRDTFRGVGRFPLLTALAAESSTADDGGLFLLSAREREVASLLALGCSNQQIAETLFITPGTVRVHVSKIYEKLKIHSRSQAIVLLLANRHRLG